MTTYLITGASGQLGQLVVASLATRVDPSKIVALVRSETAAAAFADAGIATRRGDYDDVASLEAAFAGVDRLLLISSSVVGQRTAQHKNVIDAAKSAGVSFIAYTSLLGGPASPMMMAEEHIATEALLAESGISHTILRNGWYIENFLMAAPQAIQSGQYFGASGDGRFSAASRKDFAEAAAIVLQGGHDGEVLELAGDEGFTAGEFAAALADTSGKPVRFVNLPEEALKAGLVEAGLPDLFATLLADSDAKAAGGALFNDSRTLSRLIGHPTTPYGEVVSAALVPA